METRVNQNQIVITTSSEDEKQKLPVKSYFRWQLVQLPEWQLFSASFGVPKCFLAFNLSEHYLFLLITI
jgi:hypothetical protein